MSDLHPPSRGVGRRYDIAGKEDPGDEGAKDESDFRGLSTGVPGSDDIYLVKPKPGSVMWQNLYGNLRLATLRAPSTIESDQNRSQDLPKSERGLSEESTFRLRPWPSPSKDEYEGLLPSSGSKLNMSGDNAESASLSPEHESVEFIDSDGHPVPRPDCYIEFFEKILRAIDVGENTNAVVLELLQPLLPKELLFLRTRLSITWGSYSDTSRLSAEQAAFLAMTPEDLRQESRVPICWEVDAASSMSKQMLSQVPLKLFCLPIIIHFGTIPGLPQGFLEAQRSDSLPAAPLDCAQTIPPETIKLMFSIFSGALGFHVLLNRRLQVIVDPRITTIKDIAHHPRQFGTFDVTYIEPTYAGTDGSTTTLHEEQSLNLPKYRDLNEPSDCLRVGQRVGIFVKRPLAPVSAFIGRDYTKPVRLARVGLLLESESDGTVAATIPTHAIKDSLRESKIDEFSEKTWGQKIIVAAAGGQMTQKGEVQHEIGQVFKTFDQSPRSVPLEGYSCDVSLVSVQQSADAIRAANTFKSKVQWATQEEVESCRFDSKKLIFLHDSAHLAKSIPLAASQCQFVGQAIFRSRCPGTTRKLSSWRKFPFVPFGLSNSSTTSPTEKDWCWAVTQSILFRVSQEAAYRDLEMSGTAVCFQEEGEEGAIKTAKVVGFTSFAQMAFNDYNVTGKQLNILLNKGCVTFLGATLVPDELKNDYKILYSQKDGVDIGKEEA